MVDIVSLSVHNTELWSLSPIGEVTNAGLQQADIFVRIRSRATFFLVGFLTICFSPKCLSNAETGHLLKSPTRKIPAFGYFIRAKSRLKVMCSTRA